MNNNIILAARLAEIDHVVGLLSGGMDATTLASILTYRRQMLTDMAPRSPAPGSDASDILRPQEHRLSTNPLLRLTAKPRVHPIRRGRPPAHLEPMWTEDRINLMRVMREQHGSRPQDILKAVNKLPGRPISSVRAVRSALCAHKIYLMGDPSYANSMRGIMERRRNAIADGGEK